MVSAPFRTTNEHGYKPNLIELVSVNYIENVGSSYIFQMFR